MTTALIPINYDAEQPTVSARDLHTGLEIKTAFKDWFPRMTAYGFEIGKDFCSKMSESTGGRPATDYQISVDMAKQICMIQRSEKGRLYRQYFIDLEKAWNTPEQIFARALKMADKKIEALKQDNSVLMEDVQRMKPKEIFADAVAASHTSILIGELAKLLKQNGVETGQRRLFTWMRDNGYLIKGGSSRNMPTQKVWNLDYLRLKKRQSITLMVLSGSAGPPRLPAKVSNTLLISFLLPETPYKNWYFLQGKGKNIFQLHSSRK